MKIEIFPPLSIHEIGQRDNQEDSLTQWENRLFVLCDGMGGHEKGEVASQTVCQSIITWFIDHINSEEQFSDNQLLAALEYAYQQLDQYADGNPRQMGTTLTLLYMHSQGITAMHMGDSRIYHIRPSEGLKYQSRDHSVAFDLFQAGEITYEEMLNYPQKNIVSRAMTPGPDNRMRPDIIHITDIQPNDYFLLCSDGMLENMDNRSLFAIFNSSLSDEEKKEQFVEISEISQDNHSAWILHIEDVNRKENENLLINEEPTARCNALNIFPKMDDSDDVVIVQDANPSIFQRIKKSLHLYK